MGELFFIKIRNIFSSQRNIFRKYLVILIFQQTGCEESCSLACSQLHLPRVYWSSCGVILQLSPGACPAVTGERGERGQESSLPSLDRPLLWAALTPSSVVEPAMFLSRYSQLIFVTPPHSTVLTQHSSHLTSQRSTNTTILNLLPFPGNNCHPALKMHLYKAGLGRINITASKAGQMRVCCPGLVFLLSVPVYKYLSRFQHYPRY